MPLRYLSQANRGPSAYIASASSKLMALGPATSNTCSISERVTAASLPFSEAGPLKSRQATMIGRGADTHQGHQTKVVAQPAAIDGVDLATHQLPLIEGLHACYLRVPPR